MDIEAMRAVVAAVTFPTFTFVVIEKAAAAFLVIECDARCTVTGEPLRWKSRKWVLSEYMTPSEIVQTAFLATLTALEHEARESFKYRGAAVCDPHLDLDAKAQARSARNSVATPGGATAIDAAALAPVPAPEASH